MEKYGWIIICILTLLSCKEEKKKPYSPPENIKELISGSTSKTWKLAKRYNGKTRMNMGDCFLGYLQTFTSVGTVRDNNSEQPNCGSSLEGKWSVLKDSLGYSYIRIESPQIPELMGVEQVYKDFRIFYASKDSLHLSFIHMQYGTQRRISDYLVEASVVVPDRDFHF